MKLGLKCNKVQSEIRVRIYMFFWLGYILGKGEIMVFENFEITQM